MDIERVTKLKKAHYLKKSYHIIKYAGTEAGVDTALLCYALTAIHEMIDYYEH